MKGVMMGEFSKKVGEHGEDVCEKLLEIIGWTDPLKGIDIGCLKGKDHQKSLTARRTHGMDFLEHHQSPLFDHTLQFACISSKFSNSPYPNNPIRTLKNHLRDIETLVECFIPSDDCKTIKSNYRVNRTQFAGVLVWLHSSDLEDTYDDLISKVSSIQFDGDLELSNPIYVIDNKQASFLFDCHNYMKHNFSGYDVSFFYHKSGNNNLSTLEQKSSGHKMPIEMITSKVIIYKAVNGEKTILTFITEENFSKESLMMLIGLAHEISSNLSSDIKVCFPDYKKIAHENIVRSGKSLIEDIAFKSKISVESFKPDLFN